MRLNIIQKVILVIYALVVLGLCVYVPWLGKTPQYSELQSIGYAPIWSYPKATEFAGNVDLPTLESIYTVPEQFRTPALVMFNQLSDEQFYKLFDKMFENLSSDSTASRWFKYCNWRLRQVKPIKIDSKRLLFELFAATVVFGVAVVVAHKHN